MLAQCWLSCSEVPCTTEAQWRSVSVAHGDVSDSAQFKAPTRDGQCARDIASGRGRGTAHDATKPGIGARILQERGSEMLMGLCGKFDADAFRGVRCELSGPKTQRSQNTSVLEHKLLERQTSVNKGFGDRPAQNTYVLLALRDR